MTGKQTRVVAWIAASLLAPLAVTRARPVIFDTPLSPRIANYAIDVRLDAEKGTLQAHENLSWRNASTDTITELQFHLYLNAFRNNRSTLSKESGRWRGMGIEEDGGWGFIEIGRIATAAGVDLTGAAEFIQPDDDNELDRTVMRLPLPAPLLPGDSVVLDIDFDAQLPTPPFRTGYKEEYFFVGQWYPKVGVYMDGAWNCHQFHAASEFFADFGVYDVRMTVPADFVLGATGIEVEIVRNDDGTATHYYHAEDVSDFAWTCSPEFAEYTTDTQGVEIRLLLQPDRVGQADRYLSAARIAVGYMQEWVGDYPFPNLTVIDPRRGALNSSGMEYPTLFTTVGNYAFPAGLKLQESTTIHEFAHQYWQHMVASNEFEEPWLDEGLATYSEVKAYLDGQGPGQDLVDLLGVRIGNREYSRAPHVDAGSFDQMLHRSWEYYSEGLEGVNAYFKAAMMLLTLENYLGEDVMRQVIRTYFERWRFKHPRTEDFVAVVQEVSGQDLDWYFDQVFYSNAVLDYSVSRVSTKEVKAAEGYDFTLTIPSEDTTADSANVSGGVPGAVIDSTGTMGEDFAADSAADSEEDEEKLYQSEVKVRRVGGFVFPVEVEIKFDDGETLRETWDGRDAWRTFRYTRKAKLVSAEVDPDRRVLLDVSFTNNSLTVDPEGAGVAKLWVRIMFWAQFLLDQPDFVNVASIVEGVKLE